MIANEPTSQPHFAASTVPISALDKQAAIEVRHVSKMYRIYDRPQDRLKQMLWRGRRSYGREFWALRDVSLEVRRGETLGVIGRNGSGKSTLLQIIAGTLAASAGDVLVQGRVAALLELGSGFNPEFSGRENVFLNGAILGVDRAELENRFDEIAAFADIGQFIDQPVKLYSSGMFVRLAFAVQACLDPDVLIVDEALSVGDIFFQQKCAARIQHLVDQGTAILFVSHDLSSVSQLCQRVMLLDGGHAIEYGEPKLVLERYTALMYERERERLIGGQITDFQQQSADNLLPIDLHSISDEVFRHGDGGMRILGYMLNLGEGMGGQCEPGAVAKLTLEIQASEPGLLPNVGFQIRDRFGNISCGTNTAMLGIILAPQASNAIFRITFEIALMLGSGEYTFTVAVSSPDAKPERVYDWIEQLTSIVIVPHRTSWVDGLAYCPVNVSSAAILATKAPYHAI